jgi:hypothetical protein
MIDMFKNGMTVNKYSLIESIEELLRLANSSQENIFGILELSKKITDQCKDKIKLKIIDNLMCELDAGNKLSRNDLSRLVDYMKSM